MARTRLLAASAAALLALTLTACSGQTGTPAAAPQTSTITTAPSSTSSSAPATVTITTRLPASTTSSSTPTSKIRDSVVTTSSSADYPYDTTNYVRFDSGLRYYYCDDVFVNFKDTSYCSTQQQTFWDATAYYNPTGFDSFAHTVVNADLFSDDVLVTDILAYGLVACDDFITLGGTQDVISAGALVYESRPLFDSDQQETAEQIYTYALTTLCAPLDT